MRWLEWMIGGWELAGYVTMTVGMIWAYRQAERRRLRISIVLFATGIGMMTLAIGSRLTFAQARIQELETRVKVLELRFEWRATPPFNVMGEK